MEGFRLAWIAARRGEGITADDGGCSGCRLEADEGLAGVSAFLLGVALDLRGSGDSFSLPWLSVARALGGRR
jgi:hypothetical protein